MTLGFVDVVLEKIFAVVVAVAAVVDVVVVVYIAVVLAVDIAVVVSVVVVVDTVVVDVAVDVVHIVVDIVVSVVVDIVVDVAVVVVVAVVVHIVVVVFDRAHPPPVAPRPRVAPLDPNGRNRTRPGADARVFPRRLRHRRTSAFGPGTSGTSPRTASDERSGPALPRSGRRT